MAVNDINIKQAKIYGFGKWVDYSIDFDKESLICIYGENESGKSTLREFILFMLFGLPPKKRTFFRPKMSDKMGGRLTMTDPEIGDFTIERLDQVNNGEATCYLPAGLEAGEDWLKKRFKGTTREIYQSIFSFSALDLNDFTSMKDEDLGEILLGIGLTSSNNIYHIEKQLEQKIGKLFKPSGKVPLINQQLESLDHQLKVLTDAKDNEVMYRGKQEQAQKLLLKIDQLLINLQRAKERQLIIEKHQRNLPLVNDYHLCKNQLFQLPAKHRFPENGAGRLSILKEQLLPFKSEHSVLKANHVQYEQICKKITDELLDRQIYEKANQLLQQAQEFRKHQQEHDRLVKEISVLQIKVDTALQALNAGLTSDKLSQTSLSFYTETAWKELKHEADQLQLAKEQLAYDQHSLKKQQVYLTNQLTEIENKLLTSNQQDELYARLDAYKAHDYLKGLGNQTNAKQKAWKKEKQRKEKGMKMLLISSMILGGVSGSAGLLFELPIFYYVMFILMMFGCGQWVWGKKSIIEIARFFTTDQVREHAAPIVTADEKQEAETLLMKDDENRSMLRSIRDQLKSIDIQLIQWNEKQYMWKKREENLQQQIDTQIDDYPFLKQIDLRHWPDFFHTIKRELDHLHEQKKMQLQTEKYHKKLMTYRGNLQKFVTGFSEDTATDSLEHLLSVLKGIVKKDDDLRRSLQQYDQLIIENKANKMENKQKMAIFEQEIQELFAIAMVETEEDFYKKDKINNERLVVENRIQTLSDQLQSVCTAEEWKELTAHKPDSNDLEIKHQRIMLESEEIETSLHALRQDLADINAELSNMETSEVYSQAMHRFEVEKEQLAKLAREWAVLKTAKAMLAETKRKYRDKYLTSVMKKTSTYFKILTNHAYLHVIEPVADKSFQVETADHTRYQVNELSQGTIDQLYVCLRLAISEIMSEKHALPFIIDDAFVHFDDARTRRMMDILMQISTNRQVLMFTCKSEVKKLFEENNMIHLTR